MATGRDVFMIGPGFIGWNILDILLEQGYNVTTLARRRDHAEQLRLSGAKVIIGSMEDLDVIQKHVAASDIVHQVATGDNLELERTIIAGIRQRAESNKQTIYVHTSGAKVLDDGALGMFKSDKIYDDDGPEGIDSVSDDAPHRDVDLYLVNAQKELKPHLKLAIMLPPEVYGWDEKHKRLSMMFPKLTLFAIKHGYVPIIGEGLSMETQIHVMDLARGYIEAMHFLERETIETVLANPYWLCENGIEFSWKEAANVVAKALHEKGKLSDTIPRNPPKEVWSELSGDKTPSYMGLNCRARAVRLRQLGWEAREKGIWQSYCQDELPQILQRIAEGKRENISS